uniref:Sodium channel and clathrin linker 1 n=1 Tax=Callorhinchus milii TaxID=7868 RepID=A0A4W3GBX5_CALMI
MEFQIQRLNSALRQYQAQELSKPAVDQTGHLEECHSPVPWLTDKSLMAPLIIEYDKNMEELNEQICYYQTKMNEMKLNLESVIRENERLHTELRENIEKHLQTLPGGAGIDDDPLVEDTMVSSLQEQLRLANREKNQALELWQTVSQELDRLQQMYQEHVSESERQTFDQRRQKEQLTRFQQLTQQLQLANENMTTTNQQFVKTVTEQNVELEVNHKELRRAKLDMRTATLKVVEMNQIMQNLQEEIQRKDEDVATALGREEASDKRLQKLQSAITKLEARLRVAVEDAEQLRKERFCFERQIGALQAKCAEMEEEKYDSVVKVRDSIQLLEEANLQKDQALLREKQKDEEIEKMKEAVFQLIQEAAARTRKEVENVRKQCNVQISHLAEDLSILQMDNADKEGRIARAIREKRAVEEELEKLYREGRCTEDHKKIDELHQRCLNAERAKDDLHMSLQGAQSKIRKFEINSEEESSRCQEMVQKLQSMLDSVRSDCDHVSEERLSLQHENEQLRKEMEELKKASMETQRKAKQQIATMEHECSLKGHGFQTQLSELEETSRNSSNELKRLLIAQQKAASRWRDEARKLTNAFEAKINNMKTEMNRQKHHLQEMVSQLENAHEQIIEYEKRLMENQEKTNRLQRRLTNSEHRAATASQKLSRITTQRRKDTSQADVCQRAMCT